MKRILLSAALALLAVGANADPILVVDPIPANPALGSQVVVNVSVGDPDGLFIDSYELDLFFNETILSFAGIAFGSFLDGLDPFDPSDQFFDFGPGFVNVFELSFAGIFDGQDGSSMFPLFDITFDVIDTGFTDLFLEGIVTGVDFDPDTIDSFPMFDVFSESSLEAVPVQVPEPGTLALFGIGLLGLGLARRRNRTI